MLIASFQLYTMYMFENMYVIGIFVEAENISTPFEAAFKADVLILT